MGKTNNLLIELRTSGLVLASRNKGKLQEFERILTPLGIQVHSPEALGCSLDPEETGSTFQDNAAIKALEFYQALGKPLLADDSGLVVDALQGEPGIYSARYGGEGLDDVGRNNLILEKLKNIPLEERTARFVCVLALSLDGLRENLKFFRGVVEGHILFETRGTNGFGYDPLFGDLETGRSFGELTADEKDGKSHRGQAIELFLEALR